MNYSTSVFLDIVESVPGVSFLRQALEDGVHVRFYQGLRGNVVLIDTTEEDLSDFQAKGYLKQLGLNHLIESMFPPNDLNSSVQA